MMRISRFVAGAALVTSLLAPAVASAADEGRCSLGGMYRVLSVGRYDLEDHTGYTTEKRFLGAEIDVAAQPGLTREWLQRRLEMEMAAGTCDFGIRDAQVDVLSSGDRFAVRITGADRRAAEEILRHAQVLTPR